MTDRPIGEPSLLTPRQAAKELGISQRKLWQLSNEGQLPVVRIGRSVRYRQSDLWEFIERHIVIGCRRLQKPTLPPKTMKA